MNVTLGAIGDPVRAHVDEHGTVVTGRVALAWWVGADDGWHVPGEDPTTRTRRPDPAPVVETALRVPGGDVVQRAYGVTGATVIDVENASPEACALAFVARIDDSVRARLDGNVLLVDGTPAVVLPRPPGLWAAARSVRPLVEGGDATRTGETSWRGPIEVALLVPMPHRTRVRLALAEEVVDVTHVPDPASVVQAWDRHLDRAMRVELPEPWGSAVDAARADLLLAPPSAPVVAALEDWGFDAEAREQWAHLGFRARRAARRRAPRHRAPASGAWDAVRAASAASDAAAYLLAMRRLLLDEQGGTLDLLPGFPAEWLGAGIAVHDLPLRSGVVSFALRWHGARPALLWDAPSGVTVRATALDAAWSAAGGTGETLLAEPPAPLLAMGSARRAGARPARAPLDDDPLDDDPGSFS